MWRPELVALDIDGTIVDYAGVLPEEIRAAVRRIVDAGVPVVLATGRGWHATRPVFEELGLPWGYAVSANGAVVVTHPPTEIVRQVTFEPGDVLDRVERMAPHALVAIEEVGSGYLVSAEFPEGELTGEIAVVPREQLRAKPVTRVVIRDPNSSDKEFVQLAERLGLHGVGYFIGYTAWLDIVPEGVHKAVGLAEVCDRLGIAGSGVLALGDGRNDIEMLRWAGRGVAIGDAPDEVKAAADDVTGRFAEGGTLRELQRWFG